jgi:hypothetical protein
MVLRLVPGGGIEPPQGFWPLRILSPLRLPISPSRPNLFAMTYCVYPDTGSASVAVLVAVASSFSTAAS